jgi:DNA-binding response OmpR family regulator
LRVLLIEDYEPLATSLGQGLRETGYAVDVTGDGNEALLYAESNPYDAIVLDLMLPGLDGLSVLERLRARGNTTPVLIMTAKDKVDDRVAGLDRGADDYLVKPFAFKELAARLRALIRRRYQAPGGLLRVADLEIDLTARRARRAGQPLPLSAREYAVLEYLALRKGQVVTRTEIWEHIYDFAAEPGSNVVDVYISYLRKKVDQGHAARLIHTRRGQGYVLDEEP